MENGWKRIEWLWRDGLGARTVERGCEWADDEQKEQKERGVQEIGLDGWCHWGQARSWWGRSRLAAEDAPSGQFWKFMRHPLFSKWR